MVHKPPPYAERQHLLLRSIDFAGHLRLVPLPPAFVLPTRLPLYLKTKKKEKKAEDEATIFHGENGKRYIYMDVGAWRTVRFAISWMPSWPVQIATIEDNVDDVADIVDWWGGRCIH